MLGNTLKWVTPEPVKRERMMWERLSAATLVFALSATALAQQVTVDADDIGGTVTSADGPEAGVWVIAETDDLGTRFARIVVTDDAGRYLVPDLPAANYQVWVRGYGLADSPKVAATRGANLDLTAVVAPDAKTAAQVYPAAYWYAMMRIPPQEEVSKLPGGLNQYLGAMKNLSCVGCHQLGQLSTRTLPEAFSHFENSEQAWIRRVSSGQAGQQMVGSLSNQLQSIPFKYLGDWTDRIAAGELPAEAPERPSGLERNVVATVRDWSDGKAYMVSSTGRRSSAPTISRSSIPSRTRRRHSYIQSAMPTRRRRKRHRRLSRRLIGARRRFGTARRTHTTRCSIARAASGTRRGSVESRTPHSAGPDRNIRRRSSSRSSVRAGTSRSTFQRRRKRYSSIRASGLIICASPRMAATRSG
jgi:hypothetical protein